MGYVGMISGQSQETYYEQHAPTVPRSDVGELFDEDTVLGTRTTGTSQIINGATVMMPIASDANQCDHVFRAGTSGV